MARHGMPLRGYNLLLRDLARRGSFGSVMALYYELRGHGLVADSFTYPFVLKAVGALKLCAEGRKAHALAAKTGFQCNAYTASSLLEMYATLGREDLARKLFDEMPHRTLVLWNVMIGCYVKCGRFTAAIALFEDMSKCGVVPDKVTLVSAVTACTGAKDLSWGRRIHVYMDGVFGFSLPVANALLDMYMKCGSFDAAMAFFERMQERNVVSWTTAMTGYASAGNVDDARALFDQCMEKDVILWGAMINVYVQHRRFEEALHLFRDMQMQRVDPDRFIIVAVLTCCASTGALEEGEWLHRYIEHRQMKVDAVIGTALIDMYSKCGRVEKSLEIFGVIGGKDTAAWTAMICGLGANGQTGRALALFEEMQRVGARPDGITFISVLSACDHGGLVDEGRKYFRAMEECRIEPRVEHYSCLVDLLGRAGLLDEAEELISNMPGGTSTDALPLWGALLTACREHGNVEMGERLADRIGKLVSQTSGMDLLMSNIYARASRWEDAARARREMTDSRAKKTAGRSSVEVTGHGG